MLGTASARISLVLGLCLGARVVPNEEDVALEEEPLYGELDQDGCDATQRALVTKAHQRTDEFGGTGGGTCRTIDRTIADVPSGLRYGISYVQAFVPIIWVPPVIWAVQ